jgi:phosphomannomutase
MDEIQVIAFDIDDTLTQSKMPLDEEMADLLRRLLRVYKVAIISGASIEQIQLQIIHYLKCSDDELKALYLLPTNGSSLYEYKEGWKEVYNHSLTTEEKNKVMQAFDEVFEETHFQKPSTIYGVLIEDRGSQITFSGLGSTAPIELKKAWDPDHAKRTLLQKALSQRIPEFAISIGGSTSLDITRKGIDKAYGLRELMSYLHIGPHNLLYIGDAFFPDGNDSSVISLKVPYISEDKIGLEDTKHTLHTLLGDEP